MPKVTTRNRDGEVVSDQIVPGESNEPLDVSAASLTFRAAAEVAPVTRAVALAMVGGAPCNVTGVQDLPAAVAYPVDNEPETPPGAFTAPVEGDGIDVGPYWRAALLVLPEEPDLAVLAAPGADLSRRRIDALLDALEEDPSAGAAFECVEGGRIYGPPSGAVAVAVRAGLVLNTDALHEEGNASRVLWSICEAAVRYRYRVIGVEVEGAAAPPDCGRAKRLREEHSDPEATFIIPAYNAEEWIAEAVESALGQEGAIVDAVVVDDGSTDGTLEELVRLRREHGPRLIIMTQPNSGPSAARNYGVRRALGEVLVFLDADDVAPPDRARLSIEALENADVCIGQVSMFEEGAGPDTAIDVGRIAAPTPETIVGNAGGFRIGAAATRRRLHEELGVWLDEEMEGHEDYEFAVAATAAGAQWSTVEEPTLYRRNVKTSRRRRECLNRRLLKRWALLKHRDFLAEYATEPVPVTEEEARAMRVLRARCVAKVTRRRRRRQDVAPDARFEPWHGFPGPAFPPGDGEPVRVLMHLFGAAGEGLEAFAAYLCGAMPDGAVEWMFTVSHPRENSGAQLERYGEVRLLSTDDHDWRWWDFYRAVLDFRPHVVHSSYKDGGRWAQQCGLPLLTTVHGITGGGLYGAQFSDLAVSVSPAASEGADRVILSGVDEAEWPRRRQRGTFAWCGRLDAEVNPEAFLDALAMVPAARGLIMGKANRREWDCQAQLEKRGLADRVDYLGQLPQEEARRRLGECDATVVAVDHSFGFSTAEAMVRGTIPVVVSGPGYQEQMVGEWGVVCEPTADGLARGMRTLLDDEDRSDRRRPMAAAAAGRFSAERMAKQYLAAYRELLLPPIDVVILANNSHKNLDVTRAAIKHHEAHTWVPYRLVLVDNGSEDGGRTWNYFRSVRNEYDALYGPGRCEVVRSEVNLGAPGGRNLGFEHVRSPFFAPFDDDMLVPPGWAAPLLRVMLERPKCAIVAPWWEGYEPGLRGGKLRRWNVGGTTAIFRTGAVASVEEPDQPGVLFVEPFASLQGRADTDLVCRLLEADYEVLLDPSVECHHLGGLVRKRPGMTRRFADRSGIDEAQERWREKWTDWGVRRGRT